MSLAYKNTPNANQYTFLYRTDLMKLPFGNIFENLQN